MKKNANRIEQAVILAAGEGQRLKPLTTLRPKVMLPLGGKPILQYVVEALVQSGIRRLLVVVGYHREQVQDYFGSGYNFGAEIDYVIQERQLGTAHALLQTKGLTDDRFIVVPGDNIVESALISSFLQEKSFTVLTKKVTDKNMLGRGIVEIGEGVVKRIIESSTPGIDGLINTGIYVLENSIFEFIGNELELPQVISKMIDEGNVISYHETSGRWFDVVHHPDLLKLNDIVLRDLVSSIGGNIEIGTTIKGRVSIGKGTTIRANCYIVGPVSIGDNCEIGPNACILPSTSIGNNTVVAPFALIKNSLIFSNVNIGPNSTVEDSVISRGTIIRGHFIAYGGEMNKYIEGLGQRTIRMGTVIGDGCQFEDSINIRPGLTIGNYCHIRALKNIYENIPDESIVM